MKVLGAIALLLGVALLVFTLLTYSEFNALVSSPTPPAAEEMRLVGIVGPELSDPKHATTKPAVLAGIVMNRIYLMGGGSILCMALGGLMITLGRARKRD